MAFMWCGLVVFLPIVVPVNAVLLSVAVRLTNRVLGRPPADRDHGYAVDEYVLPPARAAVIPVPEFGRAAGITVAVVVVDLATGIGLAILERNTGLEQAESRLVFGSAALATAFLMQAGLLTLLLPTTVPRASLVAAFALS